MIIANIMSAISCFISEQLRALYLGDNDFETLPDEIGELRNLQVVTCSLILKQYVAHSGFSV